MTANLSCPSRPLVDLVQRDWPATLASQLTSGAWPRPLWESAQLRLQDVQSEANRQLEWFQARLLAGAMVLELGTDPSATNNTLPVIRPQDPIPAVIGSDAPAASSTVLVLGTPTSSTVSSLVQFPSPTDTSVVSGRDQPVIVRATVPPPTSSTARRLEVSPEPTFKPSIPNSILLYLFSDSSVVLVYPSNQTVPADVGNKLAKCDQSKPTNLNLPRLSQPLQRRSGLALGCIQHSSRAEPESCFFATDFRTLSCGPGSGADASGCTGVPVFLDTAASQAALSRQPPKWIVASIVAGALAFIFAVMLTAWFMIRVRRLSSPRLTDAELAGMYGESSLSQTQLPPRRDSLLAPTAYTTDALDPYHSADGRRNSTSSVPLLQASYHDHRLATSDQPLTRQYRRASDSFVADARFGEQSPILQHVQEQMLRQAVEPSSQSHAEQNENDSRPTLESQGALARLRQLLFSSNTTSSTSRPRPQSLPPPSSPPTVERTLRRANRTLRGVIPPTPSGGGMQSVYLLPLTFGHQPSPHYTLLSPPPNMTPSAMQDLLNGWTRVRFLADAAVHHLPLDTHPLALAAVGVALVEAMRLTDHLRLKFPSTPTVSELRESSATLHGMLQWFNAAEQSLRDIDPAHVPRSHPFFTATLGIVAQAQQAANQEWIPQDTGQVVDCSRVVRAALISLIQIKTLVPFVAGIVGIPDRPMDVRVMAVDTVRSPIGPGLSSGTGGGGALASMGRFGEAKVTRAVFPGLMDLATGRVLYRCLVQVQ